MHHRRIITVRAALAAAALLLALGAAVVLAQPATAPLTQAELENLTYPNDFTDAGAAPLSDGAYSEEAAPGSAGMIEVMLIGTAFGTVDGAPVAAAVLRTETPGSGTFYDLHAVGRAPDGTPEVTDTVALGDRVGLHALQVLGDRIVVDRRGFADDDPLCCPTLNVHTAYALGADGALQLEVATPLPAVRDVPAGLSLVGWYGAPTTSAAVLAGSGLVDRVWWYDPQADGWRVDSRDLPPALRQPFPLERGDGFFVVMRDAGALPVWLHTAPAPCPVNPGPPQPLDPSMIVFTPGNGAHISSPIAISGLARVFEATVSIRVLDADGGLLAETFTTASAGGPEFGAFAVEVDVALSEDTPACVQVFESSARDGEPVNVVQRGVVLQPTP